LRFVAWLKVYQKRRKGVRGNRIISLTEGQLREARVNIFHKVAGISAKYIPAGLRHTYASAMINSGKTIDETVLALGHEGNSKMHWNHYHLAIPKDQAEAYWKIFPPA
jgi:site-specific recombinase XerD